MKKTTRVGASLVLAAGLAACGSSSSGTVPQPSPPASGGPVVASALTAARGTMQVALASLHTHLLIAEFVRPGTGAMIPASPSPSGSPVCDPAGGGSATLTTTDLPQAYRFTRFAFYPPGDATCSQQPIALGALSYVNPNGPIAPAAGQPVVAQGYIVGYAQGNDPYFTPRTPVDMDTLTMTVYAAADGQANVALQLVGSAAGSATAPQRPAGGSFPGSFPSGIPISLTPASELHTETALAVLEKANNVSSSVLSGPTQRLDGSVTFASDGTFPNVIPPGGMLYGQLASTSSMTPASGATAFTASATTASYGISGDTGIPYQLTGFPPAAGQLAFPPQALGTGATLVSPANFFTAQTDTATVSSGGTVSALDEKFVDAASQVSAEIRASTGGYTLTLTDMISGKAMTSPAAIALDALGTSAPFTYLFDGTNGAVRDFVVLE